MRKSFLVLSAFCGLAMFGANAQEHPTQTAPSIGASLRKAVVLIQSQVVTDSGPVTVSGTGFLVGYLDNRLPTGQTFVYLITNRHVAEPGADEGKQFTVSSSSVVFNLKSPASHAEAFPLSPQAHWYFPADASVDLATTPVTLKPDIMDFTVIPSDGFATKDVVAAHGISEGDSVMFSGLFYQFPGIKMFEPIVREGTIAMMPEEEMETTLHKMGHLYLAEVHAFNGNSGSPLLVNIGGLRGNGFSGIHYVLFGVISGYYHEDSKMTLTIATTFEGTVKQNSGIAMVVPVDYVKDLLDDPELQALRDKFVAEHPAPPK